MLTEHIFKAFHVSKAFLVFALRRASEVTWSSHWGKYFLWPAKHTHKYHRLPLSYGSQYVSSAVLSPMALPLLWFRKRLVLRGPHAFSVMARKKEWAALQRDLDNHKAWVQANVEMLKARDGHGLRGKLRQKRGGGRARHV